MFPQVVTLLKQVVASNEVALKVIKTDRHILAPEDLAYLVAHKIDDGLELQLMYQSPANVVDDVEFSSVLSCLLRQQSVNRIQIADLQDGFS